MALTRYDVFLKVISHRSFSKAAEELGYTQSAVSQSINQMEKEMGFRLIDRSRNNIKLTPEGEEIFPLIEMAAESERIIENKIQEMKGILTGTVNIGACRHVSCVLKPEIMAGFSEKFPQVSINIIHESTEELKHMMESGRVDFCIREIDEHREGDTGILYRDRYKVALPKDHELAGAQHIDLEQLGARALDSVKEGRGLLVFAEGCGGDERFRSFSTNDTAMFLSMVEAGYGAGLVPESALIKNSRDIAVKDTDLPVYRNLGIVTRRKAGMSQSARAFIDYLTEYYKD